MEWRSLVCLILVLSTSAGYTINRERSKRQASPNRPNNGASISQTNSNSEASGRVRDDNQPSNAGTANTAATNEESGDPTTANGNRSNYTDAPDGLQSNSSQRNPVPSNNGAGSAGNARPDNNSSAANPDSARPNNGAQSNNRDQQGTRRVTKNKISRGGGRVPGVRPSGPTAAANNANNAKLPPRSRKQIQEEFPWIETPDSTDVPGRIPQDGRARLYNPGAIRRRLKLADEYDLRPRFGSRGPFETYRVRMDQTWRGVKVYGSRLLAEQEHTGLFLDDTLDGDYYENIEDDLASSEPQLSEDEAISLAKAHNNDTETRTRNSRVRLFVSIINDVAVLTYMVDYFVPGTDMPSREETVADEVNQPANRGSSGNSGRRNRGNSRGNRSENALENEQGPNFRRKMRDMREDMKMQRPVVVLDANNGTIYRSWDGLANAAPEKISMRHGNPNAGFDSSDAYVLKNNDDCFYEYPLSRSRKLRLNDQQDAQNSLMKKFPCSQATSTTYDVTSGAASPRNSAWVWTIASMAFMKNPAGFTIRNIDDDEGYDAIFADGYTVDIEVHHTGVVATWTGTQLIFGDGNSAIYPLTEPDIVAHEVAHIYTEYMSDLEYIGQSGGLSESFSDMAAIAFLNKQFNTPTSDMTIGKRLSVSNRPLKDMCNPNSPLTLTYNTAYPYLENVNQISTYSGFTVHQAAGIYNKVFCYLVQQSGWSIQNTFKVFVDANMNYWNPQESFSSGVCGVRKAARDLYGESILTTVDEAFLTVGAQCSE